MMLFDTHAHYDASRFDADRHQLLASMAEHGVGRILNAGCDLASSRAAVELAHRYGFVWAAVGTHPDDADHVDGALLDAYRALAADERVAAIGEIGLDYHYEDVPREIQKTAFRMQLELAAELGLPVIVHERRPTPTPWRSCGRCPGSPVCSTAIPARWKWPGSWCAWAGNTRSSVVLTFKNARKALEVAENIPLPRLLLETDCPYMAPEPYRGRRCDSTMLVETARKLAELRDVSLPEIARITWENGTRLFGLPD